MPHDPPDLPLPNLTGQIPYDVEDAIDRLRAYGVHLAAAQEAVKEEVATLIVAVAAAARGGEGGASSLTPIQRSIEIITEILTLIGFTPDSIVFIGDEGQLSEDPNQLLWKAITNRLGVGVADPLTQVDVAGTITARADLQVMEPGGANVTGWRAPALAADVIYTLPPTDGALNDALTTNGARILSWAPGGGGGPDAGYWSPLILSNNPGDSELVLADDAPVIIWIPTP